MQRRAESRQDSIALTRGRDAHGRIAARLVLFMGLSRCKAEKSARPRLHHRREFLNIHAPTRGRDAHGFVSKKADGLAAPRAAGAVHGPAAAGVVFATAVVARATGAPAVPIYRHRLPEHAVPHRGAAAAAAAAAKATAVVSGPRATTKSVDRRWIMQWARLYRA